MPKDFSLLPPVRAARRLPAIFAATILAPALILGFFGVRALVQERRLADRQIREQLDTVAQNAGRRLELEIREWQQAVEQLARADPANPADWPELVREALAEPATAVVLTGIPDRVQILPPARLLYELVPVMEESSPPPPSSLRTHAETLEREKQYDKAVAAYRQLLNSAKAAQRTRLMHALARTLRKAGHADEAVHWFRIIEGEASVPIGSLPSDLIALYELTSMRSGPARADDALRLYRELVRGRWRLEKASYLFYSENAQQWLADDEEGRALAVLERKKLALTQAAENFAQNPRSFASEKESAFIAFSNPEPFAVFIAGAEFIERRLLPASDAADFEFSLLAPGGEPLSAYSIKNAGWPLQLYAWPKDTAALYAAVDRRQNLYLGMFAVMTALLAFGAYLTVRTLKTELAMAQLKSDFVSTVSHEFRSPLAGINQLGEMLRDGRVSDPQRRQEYYAMIVGETQRLRRLVENILDFSRMEDGRKQYRFEPLDSAGWLHELARDFQNQVTGRGFTLRTEIPKELPGIVGDRETLSTAVNNLLDNAVKYSKGDSRSIQLAARAANGGISISIRDRGIGIPEADRPHIFEKFYRGRAEPAMQVKGAGLGLSLVRHIVTAHGGTVDFQTAEGEGTTFTIHLKTGDGNHGAHTAG